MKFWIALGLGLSLFTGAGAAEAVVFTESGAELTVEYDEPTTNVDGTPLADLSKTTIAITVMHPSGGAPQVIDVPASRPQGGGHVIRKITVGIGIDKPIKEANVEARITATDTVGNQSDPAVATVRVDKLRPAKVN